MGTRVISSTEEKEGLVLTVVLHAAILALLLLSQTKMLSDRDVEKPLTVQFLPRPVQEDLSSSKVKQRGGSSSHKIFNVIPEPEVAIASSSEQRDAFAAPVAKDQSQVPLQPPVPQVTQAPVTQSPVQQVLMTKAVQAGVSSGTGTGSGVGTGSGSGVGAGGSLTPAKWLYKPTGKELAAFYPKGASKNGEVRLRCQVNRLNRAHNCQVVQEVPAGFGFGAAAVEASSLFRVGPRMLNGVPQYDAWFTVTVPFEFKLTVKRTEGMEVE